MGREKKQERKKLSDNIKAGIFRWWMVGMCYFFIGFGTQMGMFADPLDLIFFLGLAIGLATIFLYNPIAYRMFNMVRKGKISNQSYFERTGWQNALLKLGEILKNIVLVFLVYMTYQNINMLLEQLLELPSETVVIPGEPIGFAFIYIIYHSLLTGLMDTAGGALRRDGRESHV